MSFDILGKKLKKYFFACLSAVPRGMSLDWEFRKLRFKSVLGHLPCNFINSLFFS